MKIAKNTKMKPNKKEGMSIKGVVAGVITGLLIAVFIPNGFCTIAPASSPVSIGRP